MGVHSSWVQLPTDSSTWLSHCMAYVGRRVPDITTYYKTISFHESDPVSGWAEGLIELINDAAAIPIIIKQFRLSPIDQLALPDGSMVPLTSENLASLYRTQTIGVGKSDGGYMSSDYEGPTRQVQHIGSKNLKHRRGGFTMVREASLDEKMDKIAYDLVHLPKETRDLIREKVASDQATYNHFQENLPILIDALNPILDSIRDEELAKVASLNSPTQEDDGEVMVLQKHASKYYLNGEVLDKEQLVKVSSELNLSIKDKQDLVSGEALIFDSRDQSSLNKVALYKTANSEPSAGDETQVDPVTGLPFNSNTGAGTEIQTITMGTVFYGGRAFPGSYILQSYGSGKGVQAFVFNSHFYSIAHNPLIEDQVSVPLLTLLKALGTERNLTTTEKYLKISVRSYNHGSQPTSFYADFKAPISFAGVRTFGKTTLTTADEYENIQFTTNWPPSSGSLGSCSGWDRRTRELKETIWDPKTDRYIALPDWCVAITPTPEVNLSQPQGYTQSIKMSTDGQIVYGEKYVSNKKGISSLMTDLRIPGEAAAFLLAELKEKVTDQGGSLIVDIVENSSKSVKEFASIGVDLPVLQGSVIKAAAIKGMDQIHNVAKAKNQDLTSSYIGGLLGLFKENLTMEELQEIIDDISEVVKTLSKLLFKIRMNEDTTIKEEDLTLIITKLNELNSDLGGNLVEADQSTGLKNKPSTEGEPEFMMGL